MQDKIASESTTETKAAPKDDYVLAVGEEETQTATPEEPTENAATQESEEESVASETAENEDTEIASNESAALEVTDSEEGEGKPAKKGGFQRRIDKLTKRNSKLSQELELTKRLLMERANQSGEQTQSTKEQPQETAAAKTEKPKRADFETLEDYTEALTDWKVDQKISAKQESDTKAKAQAAAKSSAEKLKFDHLDRYEKYAKENPEFAEDMEDFKTAKVSFNVQFAIMESDFGPQLMHEFAKSPEFLDRLNKMDPAKAQREIGKLEAKFEKSSTETTETAAKNPSAKKVSTAPKPITPINSKAGRVKTSRDPLPYDEWKKVREAEMKGG